MNLNNLNPRSILRSSCGWISQTVRWHNPLWCLYQGTSFKIKAEILLYVLDYPGLGKVMRMSGSGAYEGCAWCDIKGRYTYIAVAMQVYIYI